MSCLELDWRTGEIYIDSAGKNPWIDGMISLYQAVVNAVRTWHGSDRDIMDFGPDWLFIMTLPANEDPTPYIIVELTRTLSPNYDSRISRLDGVSVLQKHSEEGRRYYEVTAFLISDSGERIDIMQVYFP